MNSESWLRTQYQNVIKERDELQLQCEQLKNENYDLKKAVFELTQQISLTKQFNLFSYNSLNKQFEFKSLLNYDYVNNNNNNNNNTNNITNNNNANPLYLEDNQIIQRNNENRTLSFECELRGHSGAVYCVDISPDNRWIASGSFDNKIVIWKGNFPYKQIATLTGHTQLVSGVCWGCDPLISSQEKDKKNDILSPILFSISFDKTVRIWDPIKEVCIEVVKLKGYGTSLSFCPRSTLYPRGCVIATTSTNYFYLISHPFNSDDINKNNEIEFNENEVRPIINTDQNAHHNLLSPIQMLSSSPTFIPNTSSTHELMRSRSNSDSYVIGASISTSYNNTNNNNTNNNNNNTPTFPSPPIIPLQAVFYKHNNGVPSSVICLSDGINIIVGDTSGIITWYEMKRKDVPEGNNYTIGGYVPNIKGKYTIEEGRSVRVLHMQITSGGQKDLNSLRSNELSNSKTTTSSRYISKSQSQNSFSRNNSMLLKESTLLAIQCSDNTIRLYQLIVNSQISKNDNNNNSSNNSNNIEFLIPLRLLRDHTTGGQWPIRMSFRQGPLYRLSLPQSIHNQNKSSIQNDYPSTTIKSSGNNTNHFNLNHQPSFNRNPKQIIKIKATDITELKPSLSTNSLAATSGEDNPSISSINSNIIHNKNSSKQQSQILSDDVSVTSDPSEGNNSQLSSQLLKQPQIKQRTESRDEVDQEIEDQNSVLSAKCPTSIDDGINEVFEDESIDDDFDNKFDDDFGYNIHNNNDNDDDEDDHDNYLNMVAGLATSSLLTSNQLTFNNSNNINKNNNNSNNRNNNNFNSINNNSNNNNNNNIIDPLSLLNNQSNIKSSNIDELDILYSGINSNGDKIESNILNQQIPIQWESSLVLATGSNNGQVFIYDLSSLSIDQKKGNNENDIDSAVIIPAWKILDGHQATGKAYGAIFTSQQLQQSQSQSQQQQQQQSSLITFGSDGTLQLWSVVNES